MQNHVSMSQVQLQQLTKVYPNSVVALRDLNLEIESGELFVLVGPSGCGKTTTLRSIAGLESPTRGNVWIGGKNVTRLPPHRRSAAMVFQNHVPYPHLTVRGNLEFPLKMQWLGRRHRAERINQISRLLGLEALLDRRPWQLSGGQRQRVALGRALVRQPQVFLLDEPLSHLDAQLREETRAEIKRLLHQIKTTTLYVTHDQEQAFALGDRVGVMSGGKLQQVAAPAEIYQRPANRFVAGFVGSPPMNLIDDCSAVIAASGAEVESPYFKLQLPANCQTPTAASVTFGLRPHEVEFSDPGDADAVAEVEFFEPRGADVIVRSQLIGKDSRIPFTVVTRSANGLQIGARIGLRFPSECIHLFERESGARMNLQASDSESDYHSRYGIQRPSRDYSETNVKEL